MTMMMSVVVAVIGLETKPAMTQLLFFCYKTYPLHMS